VHGVNEAKAALRRALIRRRGALEPDAITTASRSITDHVLASDAWRAASDVAAFVGVRAEPDTAAVIDAAWQSGKALWLPRVQGDVIVFVRTTGRARWITAGFGLREPGPDEGDARTLVDIAPQLVLVPGLAFSRSGARLGFGKAYYDRALAPVRDRAGIVRMGVCFAAFLDPIEGPIPMAAHDVPMHAVATEHGIVRTA
jgi:5-formyltetrahydrofolate cyclo-ligase